jgi:AraC-like DNA-binding protein
MRSGGETIDILPQDIVFFFGKETYRNPVPHGSYSAMNIMFEMRGGDLPCRSDGPGLCFPWLTRTRNRRLEAAFEEIVLAAADPAPRMRRRASHLLAAFLIELSGLRLEDEPVRRISRVLEDINRDPAKQRTEAHCAAELGISQSTFKRLFMKECGMTLKEYLLRRKVADASAMIAAAPGKPFRSIALSLGFYDEFHFSRTFSKVMGLSPKAYRESVE